MKNYKNETAIVTGRPGVIYARVSSKEQEQGYSIPAQLTLLRQYAERQQVAVQQEFVEAETAKASGRTAFGQMIKYLRKHPDCRIVLVEKTDRLYRNFPDYVTIDDLRIETHFVKENQVLAPDSRSHDKLLHGIKVVMAKHYLDNLSEEVRKGLLTKAAQGLFPTFAPLGYVNVTLPEGKRVIVPDPVLGPLVSDLFELFALGELSLKALAKKAFEAGIRFRKSQSRIPTTTLHKILRKRIYTGEFDYGGKRYAGTHQPLVSLATWERCQEILDGRNRNKTRKSKHDFAFAGMVRCGHCGCALVAELKKGKYVYYHCTGYRGTCPEKYTREEALTEKFTHQLRGLVVVPEVLRWLRGELLQEDAREVGKQEQKMRRLQTELANLQHRLEVLYDDRLDGRIDTAKYDAKASQVMADQERLRAQMAEVEGPAATAKRSSRFLGHGQPNGGSVRCSVHRTKEKAVERGARRGSVERRRVADDVQSAV